MGPIQLLRWHGRGPSCRQVGFAADALLGLDGGITVRARRLACLAGVQDPFRTAEQLLTEWAGWSLDAETLRRHGHAAAADVAATPTTRTALPDALDQASGDRALHIDAGKVHTPQGWRDVKVAAFACRARAEAADSEDFPQRDLPAPSVRSVIAAVEEAEVFGLRCQGEARRLHRPDAEPLSVLGDGAEWLWNVADRRFAEATQLLAIYHAVQQLAEVGRAAVGEGPSLRAWLASARRKGVGDGYAGVCEVVAQPPAEGEGAGRVGEVAGRVVNSFASQRDRLGYAVRLRRGQAIGSGLVEGTIKELVNVRMKRTGARWQAGRVGRFVELLAVPGGPEWDEYWTTLAA